MYKLILALLVLVSVSNAYDYVSVYGNEIIQYYQANFCLRPNNGLNYAYLIISPTEILLNTYTDYDCQHVYTTVTIETGYQTNGDFVSVLNSLDLRATGFLYNVIYGNGTYCAGTISYASAQTLNICTQQYPNDPKSVSTQTIVCKGPNSYQVSVYSGPNCVDLQYSNIFNTVTDCSYGPGSYNMCVPDGV